MTTEKKGGAMASYKCTICGYIHEGPGAPALCPACAHPQTYYELLAENY
jgi:rubrerythrin